MRAVTPEQRAALDALSPKRRAFVLAYCGEAGGNATEAARRAGYAAPTNQGSRLLTFADVTAAILALRAPEEETRIATIQELRELWTRIARGEITDAHVSRDGAVSSVPASLSMRLRASELLGKSLGTFLERQEITGPDRAPVVLNIRRETALRVLEMTADEERERTQN